MRFEKSIRDLAKLLLTGDRRALSQAITLAESHTERDRLNASELLDRIIDSTGQSIRIGISGPPGVGKSSLIEALGKHILAVSDRKIAVLAIDPRSQISGGSILGDKTRMDDLSKSDRAYIRPSPGGPMAGGVSRRTRESILLAEAAGYDFIIVETIGVGQSESSVANMTDLFILLHQPYSGDDLQGIKRGNLELADLIVVTKADGNNISAAKRAQSDLTGALSFLATTTNPAPQVLICSSQDETGMSEIFTEIEKIVQGRQKSGALFENRKRQNISWFHEEIRQQIFEKFYRDPNIKKSTLTIENEIESGKKLPYAAAKELIDLFLQSSQRDP